jgi:hypothetical protein
MMCAVLGVCRDEEAVVGMGRARVRVNVVRRAVRTAVGFMLMGLVWFGVGDGYGVHVSSAGSLEMWCLHEAKGCVEMYCVFGRMGKCFPWFGTSGSGTGGYHYFRAS